jgi:formylglycine-generating enzyme
VEDAIRKEESRIMKNRTLFVWIGCVLMLAQGRTFGESQRFFRITSTSGTWLNSGLTQTGASGSFNFTGMTGSGTYSFGLVAIDRAGNRSAVVSGDGDCTTLYTGLAVPVNLVLPANGGRLLSYTSQYSTAYAAANLTDGQKATASGFWASVAYPGVQGFTYSFSNDLSATLSQVVIYNYSEGVYSYGEGANNLCSKEMEIWGSTNGGASYTMIANGTLAATTNAQTINLGGATANRIKLVIKSGYNTIYFELSEFEVYGTLIADTTPPVAGTVSSPATTDASPIVVTYTGASDTYGSGLSNVALWYKIGSNGIWTSSGLTQTGSSGQFNFTGMTGSNTYYFGLVATDVAGNQSSAVTGDGACTTFYTGLGVPLNLVLPANGGRLLSYTSQYGPAYAAADLTDGRLPTEVGVGFWASTVYPDVQGFTYSFSNDLPATLSHVVIYNYGEGANYMYSKDIEVWGSTDGGDNYTVIAGGRLAATTNAQTVNLGEATANRIKLVVKNGYTNTYWELSEFEVYGTLIADTTPPVAGTVSSPATTDASPITVTYTGAFDAGGSGMSDIALWYKIGSNGIWTSSGLTQTGSSGQFNFTGMTDGNTYYFGLVATDGAGNQSPAVTGDGACTTFYTGLAVPVNLLLPANGGRLLSYTSQYSTAYAAADLTDGRLPTEVGVGFWASTVYPDVQGFTYSFSNDLPATLSQTVIYNYGEGANYMYSKEIEIWGSMDGGASYTMIANGTLAATTNAQTINLGGATANRVRLVVKNGYTNTYWELSEFEVYGALIPGTIPPVAGAASSPATTNASPIIVTYTGASDSGYGLALVELWYKKNVAQTVMTSIDELGYVTWTNATPGVTCIVEVADTLEGTNVWRTFVQVPETATVMRARLFDLHPPQGMTLIPAGCYQMGNSMNDSPQSDTPVHTVYISECHMDQCGVTKAQWDDVYNWAVNRPEATRYYFDNFGQGKAMNHPVVTVSWYDIVKWCNARSEKEGLTPAYYTSSDLSTVYRTGQVDVANDWVKWDSGAYRLPTEAEWEKAARGGLIGHRFPWGDTIDQSQANYWSAPGGYDVSTNSGLNPLYNDGVYPLTSPAGSFPPNGYDLYDMAGNGAQWTWDWDDDGWYTNAAAIQVDTHGPASGAYRMIRGGCWYANGSFLRCCNRVGFAGLSPRTASDYFGFRCVR